jgi:hypothetical protein
MTISKDLFLAILAMDSYNRSYEEGIEGLGGKNSKIGSAKLLEDSSILKDENGNRIDKAAGFYAAAYDTEDYGTVISYRGTNNAIDYVRGWTIAAGVTATFSQADETLAFYTAVTGKNYWDGKADNVIVTGHSLGGGLAGLVSALTGTEGYGFDHMPFGIPAALYGFGDGVDNPPLDFENFNAIWTSNEILQSARDGTVQTVAGQVLSVAAFFLGGPAAAAFLEGLGITESSLTQYFENKIPADQKHGLESHSGVSALQVVDRALKLHMMDYLIQLQYAEDNGLEA